MKTIYLIALLALAAGWTARAQTNTSAAPRGQTFIDSDSAVFDINAHRGVYRGHVQVIDPQIKLTCDLLVVDVPTAGGHLSHVSAETNVVTDFTDEKGTTYHITSAKAVYAYSVVNSVTNDTVTWTGNPLVKTADGTISSDPLVWDRASNLFKFTHYKMVLPHTLSGTNASPTKLF